MNRKILQEIRKGEKRAISPIIATLLLILIAIAAGVVVYAYVIGFVGNSTGNTGNNTSVISIESACFEASAGTDCSGGQYYVTIRNVGTTTLASASAISLYITDNTNGNTAVLACSFTSNLMPSSATTLSPTSNGCSGSLPTIVGGNSITAKVVVSDGGSATFPVKAIP
ncbi:MAG: archaellin/type IV pilin N-terminal domain-containing protein [Nitrososphaerales archaeon]